MRYRNTFILIAGMLLFFYSAPVWPLNGQTGTGSSQKNLMTLDTTTITSATMDFGIKTSLLIFRGNVTVTDSQYILECDNLFISPDKNKIPESMRAEGNIRLKVENGEITCHKVRYSRLSGLFILEQNVVLQQENRELSADRITVTIQDSRFERVYCEGNVRSSFPLGDTFREKKDMNTD